MKKNQVAKRPIVRVILITAKQAGAGKDTLGGIIRDKFIDRIDKYDSRVGYVDIRKFAEPIVYGFEYMFGYDWHKQKNEPGIRQLLIDVSTLAKKHDKFIWINKTEKMVEDYLSPDSLSFDEFNLIFTDCRYQYEYERILAQCQRGCNNLGAKLIFKLIEIPSKNKDISDRDNPQDAIHQAPDVIIPNDLKTFKKLKETVDKNWSKIIS